MLGISRPEPGQRMGSGATCLCYRCNYHRLLTLQIVSAPSDVGSQQKAASFMFKVSSFLLLRRCYCQVAIPSSPLSSLFRSSHTFRINGCPHECSSNFCLVYGLSSSLFLPSLDLSSLTAAVRESLWLMRPRMLVSVITSLSRSLMKRLLCLASSS